MKNIAVLASDFTVEHCQDFIKGVLEFYENCPDVNVFITQTLFSHDSPGIFEYQYWSGAELLKSKQIDAYIIISAVYCSLWNKQKLEEVVSQLDNRPVISASIELDTGNCYAVVNNCNKSFDDIVKHLKEVHGCSKIAFISACSTGSPEAKERYECFLSAMKKNGLEFNEDFLFDGAFVDTEAERVFSEKLKSKADVKFDAIVSSSDLMVVGAKRVLDSLGVSVPEDVKIVSFDDSIYASLSTPKLSTINQNIVGQGAKCAEIALRVLNGEKLEHKIFSDLYPVYRQSCGCISKSDPSFIFKNTEGKICQDTTLKGNVLELYMNEILEKHKYGSLLDLVKAANTLKQLFFNLNFLVDVAMMEDLAICLYDEPVFLHKHQEADIPAKVEMIMYSTRKGDVKSYKPEIVFNRHRSLCPISSVREEKGAYIIYPIFSGEANYGYFVAKPRKKTFGAYTVNLKILISAISSAIEYTNNIVHNEELTNENHHLSEANNDLSQQAKTDDLTQLLNRRGFMEIGQRTIDIASEINNSSLVFIADMDGLKNINDTYGHEMGDKALKAQAEVLKRAFRVSDIIARLGGDEFGIVASSMTMQQVDVIRAKIKRLNAVVSKEMELPFEISISLGVVDLSSSSILTKLLTEADKSLYEEKRKKHSAAV